MLFHSWRFTLLQDYFTEALEERRHGLLARAFSNYNNQCKCGILIYDRFVGMKMILETRSLFPDHANLASMHTESKKSSYSNLIWRRLWTEQEMKSSIPATARNAHGIFRFKSALWMRHLCTEKKKGDGPWMRPNWQLKGFRVFKSGCSSVATLVVKSWTTVLPISRRWCLYHKWPLQNKCVAQFRPVLSKQFFPLGHFIKWPPTSFRATVEVASLRRFIPRWKT